MLQSLLIDPVRQVNELKIVADDVERMRKAFAGLQVSARRGVPQQVHLESGQAFMTDGWRLHTIPVRYQSTVGVDVNWRDIKENPKRSGDILVTPSFSEEFFNWQHLVPKADLGILCDIKRWLPGLTAILERGRDWLWANFTIEDRETVITPLARQGDPESIRLPHLMYKGKYLSQKPRRICNTHHMYDIFRNTADLGDPRVFLCLVADNMATPILMRGNSSAFTALVLPKK